MYQFPAIRSELDIKSFNKSKRISKIGFGLVYKVEKRETGEFFAAKIIDCGDDEDRCNRMIECELKKIMLLNHSTIIRYIGYSKTDFQGENNITLIMELANNGSLGDVLRKIQKNGVLENYTDTSRQIIITGVARGMKYLHDNNIINCNLKSDNILLDDNFHPHITDYFLSNLYEFNYLYDQIHLLNELPYKAPEILSDSQYDKKVDVYSFGILMYEVATNSIPYPDLENGKIPDFELKNKIVSKKYRPKFTQPINPSLKQLIEKCWSDNPNDRPTFDEIFTKLSDFTESRNYFLDKVDVNEFNQYVESITEVFESKEKVLNEIAAIEDENKQLKEKIDKLKIENEKQNRNYSNIEQNYQRIREENEILRASNEQQINKIEKMNQDFKNLMESIKILKEKSQQKSKKLSDIEEQNKQFKDCIEKIKNNEQNSLLTSSDYSD